MDEPARAYPVDVTTFSVMDILNGIPLWFVIIVLLIAYLTFVRKPK